MLKVLLTKCDVFYCELNATLQKELSFAIGHLCYVNCGAHLQGKRKPTQVRCRQINTP